MLLFLGAFQMLPLLLLFSVAFVAAVLAGGLGGVVGAVLGEGTSAPWLIGVAALLLALIEGLARLRERLRRRPLAISLHELSRMGHVGADQVGPKSRRLADLLAAGLPVPDGVVVTARLTERIRRRGSSATDREVWRRALPWSARRALRRFLSRSGGAPLIVRSSSPDEDGERLFPGVFESVRDVGGREVLAVLAAIRHVLAAQESDRASAYRRRHGLAATGAGAALVQVQIDADVLGVAASRAHDGRGDRLPFDLGLRGHPPRAWSYDLIDRALLPLDGRAPEPAPDWLGPFADRVLGLDACHDGPVQVEFALDGGLVWWLQVRPLLGVPRRTTWISSGLIELDRERTPPLVARARGGRALMARVLSAGLTASGVAASVEEADLARVDGVSYLNLAAWRGVQGAAMAQGRLLASLRQALLLLRPAPRVTTPGASASRFDVRAVAAFVEAEVAPRALLEAQVLAQVALLQALQGRVDAGRSLLARAARRWLGWRRRRASVARERLRRELASRERGFLEASEAFVSSQGLAEPRLVLFSEPPEVEAWLARPGERTAIEARWRARREPFEQASAAVIPVRRFEPALPERSRAAGAPIWIGAPLVAGVVAGALVRRVGGPRPRILLLRDGAPEQLSAALDADGVVLATGGALSHVAVGLMEAGVPSILCTDEDLHALPEGTGLRLDATRGVLTKLEGGG